MENNQSLKSITTILYHTLFKLIKDISDLASMEAQLASKSLGYIACLFFAVFLFSIGLWLGISVLFCISLVLLGFNWAFALFILCILNGIFIYLSVSYILKLKENLSFKATKRQLINAANLNKDIRNEQP